MPESQKSPYKLMDMIIPPSEAALPIVDDNISMTEYSKLSTLSHKAFVENQRKMYISMRSTEDALKDIRRLSIRNKDFCFTSLSHHLTASLLNEAFKQLKPKAKPGCDGKTWDKYSENLEFNINNLRSRILSGSYRPLPVLRKYIPKANGKLRPLGICSIEDKIVQNALRMILEQIYEPVFENFSYGFRPDTRAHDALDALAVTIETKEVNYILDADIVGCFDNINKNILMEILKMRIKDNRILLIIRKLLDAGVLDRGELSFSEDGVVQGSVISPLLANVFLDFVLDKFFVVWSKELGLGEMYLVRYADDFVICFQYKEEALRFKKVLEDRLMCAGLALSEEKTRLIRFGKNARNDKENGDIEKPESFNFLGFCHNCSITWKTGLFKLLRTTISSRMEKKIIDIEGRLETWLGCAGIQFTISWLNMVLKGYYGYFAVHGNLDTLSTFRYRICVIFFKALHRLSQRCIWNWDKFNRHIGKYIIIPKVQHSYPRFRIKERQEFLHKCRYEV